MRSLLLRLTQRLVVGSNLPWRLRYLVSASILKALMPIGASIEGYVGAYQVSFDVRDRIQREAYLGFYEPVHVRLLKRLLKPGDVFFDVGANVGYYSLLASQIVTSAGKVHAFEPVAESLAVLERAVNANGVSNIVLNSVGVGAGEGVVTLYTSDVGEVRNSGQASATPSENRPRPRSIRVISLDEYTRSRGVGRVRLVKIDVEGMELDVLRGMSTLLSRSDSPDLFCEVWETNSCELINCLSGHGYHLYPSPFTEALSSVRELGGIANLFCTKDPSQIGGPGGMLRRVASLFEK